MGIYFGTDGIRGVVNNDLSFDLMYKCGNALSSLKEKPTILVGRDTRVSGSFVTLGLSAGVIAGGGKIVDVGVIPTAGVAYLTKKLECDFGVVISASHNPPEFNGIKIFDKNGFKLLDEKENEIEKHFIKSKLKDSLSIGVYSYSPSFVNCYINYLVSLGCNLQGVKVVIDASNGASFSIAPKVFKKLGAIVFATNCKNNGEKINCNCGSLYPEVLKRNVLKFKADIGFAFDGDADRIIAVDSDGNIFDGDKILYILAKYLNKNCDLVVGTSQTNMAIEESLNKQNIKLIRADVGDKYVLEQMQKHSAVIGGEQSGHIINLNYSTTGDGVLTAVLICNVIKKYGALSKLFDVKLYPQTNINVAVTDKLRVINNETLSNAIHFEQEKLKQGRIMVRASGTEPKIRIMVECKNEKEGRLVAEKIADIVKRIN